jgi:hypothetical protein
MSNETPRRSVIPLVILGGLVIALAIAVVGQAIAYTSVAGGIRRQQRHLVDLQRRLHERRDWRVSYEAIARRLGPRKPMSTWSEQMPPMVKRLAGAFTAYGLRIGSLRPAAMKASGPVLRFPLEVSFRADLIGLSNLLHHLERSEPLLDIERLDIRAGRNAGDPLQVEMTIASFVVVDTTAAGEARASAAHSPVRGNGPPVSGLDRNSATVSSATPAPSGQSAIGEATE